MVALKLSQPPRGVHYSMLLHGALLALLILGLPAFLHNTPVTENATVSVDLVKDTNMKAQPPSDPVVKHHHNRSNTALKSTPPAGPAAAQSSLSLNPAHLKTIVHDNAVQSHESLDSVLRSVKSMVRKDQADMPAQTAMADTQASSTLPYRSGQPLSMSEMGVIAQQVGSKWNFNAGAKNAADLKVLLHIELGADGTVLRKDFIGDRGRYAHDPAFRAAVDSALRAVEMASPLKNLPAEKYGGINGWNSIDMDFTPPEN